MKHRIGVIGAGVIADVVHIPGILKSPDLELTALCDINPERLAEIGEKYDVPPERRFTKAEDLISSGFINAVDICTPNHCHVALAMMAIEAGLPYSIEKPVGMNRGEVEKLARLTIEKNLPHMVCFSYRFKSAARYARDLIQNGDLGKLYHVYMQYFQSWGLPVCKTPFLWRFNESLTGSGALGDLGSHGLDLIRFVTGREYTGLISRGDTFIKGRPYLDKKGMGEVTVDDFSNTMADLDGVDANMQITRFAYGRGNYQRLEIYGSKGSLLYTLGAEGEEDTLDLCLGETMRNHNDMARQVVPDRYKADQMQSFADVLNGRGDGLSATIADGLINQNLLDTILASAKTNEWKNIERMN